MPKYIQRKDDKFYRNLKNKNKAYREYDGEGLVIEVRPNGRKVWQYHYSLKNKRKTKTLGYYQPERKNVHIGVAKARIIRDELKLGLIKGIDPSQSTQTTIVTFKQIADEWLDTQQWCDGHKKRVASLLSNVIYPVVGDLSITAINGTQIADLMAVKKSGGKLSVAKAIGQRCSSIFEFGIWKGACVNNPALRKANQIKLPKAKHRPHLKANQIPDFIRDLSQYKGREYIKIGLYLMMLTFVRPSELRCAVWDEFDLKNAVWAIPAERMKKSRDHIVPLSKQAIDALLKLKQINRNSQYLFPSVHSAHKPISDVTFLKALKIMGYVDEKKIVPHGFRHTASTILNEQGFNYDHIERQLAHVQENKIRGVYNHAEYLEERTKMMQWYSGYIGTLKDANVGKKIRSIEKKL